MNEGTNNYTHVNRKEHHREQKKFKEHNFVELILKSKWN